MTGAAIRRRNSALRTRPHPPARRPSADHGRGSSTSLSDISGSCRVLPARGPGRRVEGRDALRRTFGSRPADHVSRRMRGRRDRSRIRPR
ncbi:hypothetical protein Sfr7A_01600 [Streptomyces xinghaiensis]|nr:hypothetical protein Sfr7A_01600 [Streptomyces xinghaiensis]